MAGPEQNLPGDEPSENLPQDNRTARRPPITPPGRPQMTGNRVFRRNRRYPTTPVPLNGKNPNWFDTSDMSPLDDNQNNRSAPKTPHNDDEDLPADDDPDKIRKEIEEHYPDYEPFDDTDFSDLAIKGFDSLTDEEKIKRAESLVRYAKNKAMREKEDREEEFRNYKERKYFGLQMFIGYGVAKLFMTFITAFVVLFVYVTFKDGTLNDNGVGVGILQTIQEVLRIIFSSNLSNPY